jgi:hypothetical protein
MKSAAPTGHVLPESEGTAMASKASEVNLLVHVMSTSIEWNRR